MAVFHGVNWTAYKFDHSPLSSGEGKNGWNSTCSLLYAFIAERYLFANHIQGKIFQSFEDILVIINKKSLCFSQNIYFLGLLHSKYSY